MTKGKRLGTDPFKDPTGVDALIRNTRAEKKAKKKDKKVTELRNNVTTELRNYVRMELRLPMDLSDRLRGFAFNKRMSKADIIREALEEYLKKHK